MDTNWTESEVRKWLVEKLGSSAGKDEVWEYWKELEPFNFENVLWGDTDGDDWRKSLRKEAERFIRLGMSAFGDESRKPRERVDPSDPSDDILTPHERKRAKATALALAEHAAERVPEVAAFRKDVLPGRLLTEIEAGAFLRSRALSVFPASELQERGIPIVGHSSHVTRTQFDEVPDENGVARDGFRIHVHIDPPGGDTDWVRQFAFRGVANCTDLDSKRTEKRFWDRATQGWAVEMAVPSGVHVREGRRTIYRGSTLDGLRLIAESLASWYLWKPEAAAMFVLTGQPPFSAMSSRAQAHDFEGAERAVVTLRVEAWMPAKTVTRVYVARQRRIAGTAIRSTARSLDVFVFMAERTRDLGNRPPWRQLMAEWNLKCAVEWKDEPSQVEKMQYADGDWRNFRRDCMRAKANLLTRYSQ